MKKIKVGMLMSHDYKFLQWSIPAIYGEADKIVLAVDQDRRTWHGHDFSVSDEFWQWLKEIDVDHKIEVYEDDFFVPDLLPLENDTRERNMLAQYLGRDDGWHVQVDADEVFVDFPGFVDSLRKLEKNNFDKRYKLNVKPDYIGILKSLPGGGVLQSRPSGWHYSVATNHPYYLSVRDPIDSLDILSRSKILHIWYGRSREEIVEKICNIGHNHKSDRHYFSPELYLKLWDFLDADTCRFLKAIHPTFLDDAVLAYCDYADIDDLAEQLRHFPSKAEKKRGTDAAAPGWTVLPQKIVKEMSRFFRKMQKRKSFLLKNKLRQCGFQLR